MPDLGLTELHFLRPWWLVAIVPAFLLWLVIRRRSNVERRWRSVIAPHLLSHLKVGGEGRRRFQPIHLVTILVILGALGAAGPTWEREVSPFAEDTAPLIVALDLSASMNATDVAPTRLERAKTKVRDLLELRKGARTALIAYSGTAHTVLPLCDDPGVFEAFIDALATDIMPMPGKETPRALALAEELLADEPVPGSVVFVTDGIDASHAPAFASHAERTRDAVLVLAVGTPDGGPVRTAEGGFATDASGRRIMATLDVEGLETLSDGGGAFVVGVTADNADVQRLQRRVQSHLRRAQQEDETARWKDVGYFLVIPMALLALFWFRRGWTVRWSTALLAVSLLGGCTASDTGGSRFADLWLTADQQGRWHFDRGDYATAAERFEDPLWKGVSLYREGNFEEAIDWLARSDSPEADFNLGNTYARLERYEEAVASYDAALTVRPDWVEAQENRDLVQSLIPDQEEEGDEPPPGGDPSLPPDEIEFDERGQKGEAGRVAGEQFTDEQIAEIWLRRLQTTPADFLRRRFAVEMVEAAEDSWGGRQ
jgi:Ca-activated chloride channel family protein